MDAQLRKERREAGMVVTRLKSGKRLVVLLHDSEPGSWVIWHGRNGRWYGESYERPDVMVDAPTLKGAKYDIIHEYFVACHGAGRDHEPA